MARKSIAKYLNPWMFKREKFRKRVAALRNAYGDLCWRCGGKLSFSRLATRRRATIEHLQAQSQGGNSLWDNVRLCHPGCNRLLGVRSPADKRRMRTALACSLVPESAPCPQSK